jgi:type II secretory pathway pseudopilin PulG
MNREPQAFRCSTSRELPAAQAGHRASFTLLELLISLGIILILATLTMQLLNSTLNSDRIRNGARELQTYFAGARDRAIHAGQPRGVRLITDVVNPSTVRSFVYIGASASFSDGSQLSIDASGNINFIQTNPNPLNPPPFSSTSAVWTRLWNLGLLPDGTPIELTVGTTPILIYMTVSLTGFSGGNPTFAVTSAPAGTFPIDNPTIVGGTGATYTLQLAPTVLSGDEPRSLPSNIVIDLNSSILPLAWGSAGSFSNTLDILFSPQGTVIGTPASDGKIHFVLADTADTTGQTPIAGLPPRSPLQLDAPWQANTSYVLGNVIVPTPSSFIAFRCVSSTAGQQSGGTIPGAFATITTANQSVTDNTVMWQSFVKKSNLIVSLATATGRVTTHPVDVSTQLTPAGSGYDSFRFAEIGEVQQ